jgi:hypothetical protein
MMSHLIVVSIENKFRSQKRFDGPPTTNPSKLLLLYSKENHKPVTSHQLYYTKLYRVHLVTSGISLLNVQASSISAIFRTRISAIFELTYMLKLHRYDLYHITAATMDTHFNPRCSFTCNFIIIIIKLHVERLAKSSSFTPFLSLVK